jgi:Na+/H+-translocating membrane pyrophosphatase
MENLLYSLPAFGVLGILFVFWRSAWINKQDAGTDKMKKIAEHIRVGARYLNPSFFSSFRSFQPIIFLVGVILV